MTFSKRLYLILHFRLTGRTSFKTFKTNVKMHPWEYAFHMWKLCSHFLKLTWPALIQEQRSTVSIASHFINLLEHRIMPWAEMILLLSWKMHFPLSSCWGAVFNSLLLQANLSPWPRLICCETRRQIPWAHVEPLLGKVFVMWSVGEEKTTTAIPLNGWEASVVWRGNICCW